MTVWTIGHAHDSYEELARRLEPFEIGVFIDVRSRPYIQFAHHLDKGRIAEWARKQGYKYRHMGETLGGRPHGDEYYDDEGHTLYEPLSQRDDFVAAIEELGELEGAVLVCLEEEPERCHRYHLIGRVLAEDGIEVVHIRRDGDSESQGAVAERLGENQQALLGGSAWRSAEPMRKGHNVPEHG